MSFISLFEIIKVVVVEPCILFRTPSSIAEAANVIPYGAKIFFVNGTPNFIKGTATFPITNLKIFQIELVTIFGF